MSDGQHIKSMGKKDITLFCISAILLLDTLAAGASIGASSIFWWVILGIFFFVPFSLMTAELGCTYPDQGGVYAWVSRAFGERWGARITWSYWVNIAVWFPSLCILFAGIFSQLSGANLTLNEQILIGVVLSWIGVLVNVITLDVGKWVPNAGAIIKMIVFVVIIGGAIVYSFSHPPANDLSFSSMLPTLGEGLEYLPVIIYGMLGFELVSAGSDEVRNPRKNVPQGILISGAIIILLYIFATIAILTAVPAAEINLVEGLVDTLQLFIGGSPIGDAAVIILSVGALYTFFSNGVTWSLGGNRAMAEVALDGGMPKAFAYESPSRGTPVGAAVLLGITSTIILVAYGFLAGSNEDLFWSLFAFSGVIFMIPYVAMAFAYIKLRKTAPTDKGLFRLSGPDWFVTGVAYLCAIILILTIVLFVYVPGDGMQWPVAIGAAILLALGETLILASKQQQVQ